MKTKVTTALLVLATVQSAFGQPDQPDPPYRAIAGDFSTFQETRNGQSRLDIHGETIQNITTVLSPDAKDITVEIMEGGVGYNYVTFSYKVPPEGEGSFRTLILTSEYDFHVSFSNNLPPQSDVLLAYYAKYNASNTPRTDLFSFAFDRESCTCGGESDWLNGNGSREIRGGYPNNYFDLVLVIPEGVAGFGFYECGYPIGDISTTKVRTLPHLIGAKVELALQQLYHTIPYTTTPVQHTGKYLTPEIIVSYEGGVEWYNGTGVWNIIGGRPGTYNLYYNYTQDAYTWGIVDYNVIVN